jgi:hypothetical protein
MAFKFYSHKWSQNDGKSDIERKKKMSILGGNITTVSINNNSIS